MRTVHSIADLRRLARRKLPAMVFDFVEGGALDEITLRRNRAAFDEVPLRQRVLVDTAGARTDTTVFGTRLDLPVIVSPMGLLTVCHPDADVAVARAAATAGSVFVHSPWSGCSLEEVADAAPGRVWAQISFWRNEQETQRHLDIARSHGIDTLVIAGDVAVSSKRDRDLRHGASMPPRPPLRDIIDTALHPAYLYRLATGRRLTFGTYRIDGRPLRIGDMTPWMEANENPSASWDQVADLRRRWDGRILVKGVMSAADARAALACGADGVFVSNHGGRQFDSQPGTLDVLPAVVDAVDGRATVIVDSGVRRGSDVAKALALGADVVAAGRPFAFGLAAGGRTGVARAFEILRDELLTVMGFVGARNLSQIDPSVLEAHDRPAFERPKTVLTARDVSGPKAS
jgi:L-lactate dehydrogenase (cytochrome)/(S)-mandelate dehydrogenase